MRGDRWRSAYSVIGLLIAAAVCGQSGWAETISWKKLSGDHFLVFYLGSEEFPKEVLNKAERYYENIASGLGYPRYKEFWTWDNRVKIYIYNDHASYLKETKQPSWSHGMADYITKSIASYTGSADFLVSVLPHEIAHLIFRDFVGFKSEIPLWLDEGVAQWAEEPKRKEVRALARQLYEEDKLLSVSDMMKLDLRRLKEKEGLFIRRVLSKKGDYQALFLTTDALINTYYIESVSLIDYLITKYGSYAFAEFCRRLRDGDPVQDALRKSYPDYVRSLDEFELKWREYICEEGGS